MNKQFLILSILIGCSAGYVESATLWLKNYSSRTIIVQVKKLGIGGIDALAKDYLGQIAPNGLLKQKGDIQAVFVLGYKNVEITDDIENEVAEISENDLEKYRAVGVPFPLYQKLGENTWNMSFDIDAEDIPHLYLGRRPLAQPFTILQISDVHTIAKTAEQIETMSMRYYGGDKKRDSQIARFNAKAALRDKMLEYILDAEKNVAAVIMPGDLAGGYGKRSEKNAFEYVWFNSLSSVLLQRKSSLLMGIGNHDAYWDSFFEPFPTKMLEFMEETYRDYLYAFDVGEIRCIHLGMHPAVGNQSGGFVECGPLLKDSMAFLQEQLRYRTYSGQPVLIFFHYPTDGHMSDWWSEKNKDIFYDVIKDYNVLGILCGHLHNSAIYMFRDTFPMIRAAGSEFAELSFDPASPDKLDVVFVKADGTRTPGENRLRKAAVENDNDDDEDAYLPCTCEFEDEEEA